MGIAYKPVQILNGASQSNAEFTEGSSIVGFVMPPLWDAAGLTILASVDNVLFNPVFDKNGNEYVVSVVAARFNSVPGLDLVGVRWFKLRSGTNAAPVNQTANRIIYVALEKG